VSSLPTRICLNLSSRTTHDELAPLTYFRNPDRKSASEARFAAILYSANDRGLEEDRILDDD